MTDACSFPYPRVSNSNVRNSLFPLHRHCVYCQHPILLLLFSLFKKKSALSFLIFLFVEALLHHSFFFNGSFDYSKRHRRGFWCWNGWSAETPHVWRWVSPNRLDFTLFLSPSLYMDDVLDLSVRRKSAIRSCCCLVLDDLCQVLGICGLSLFYFFFFFLLLLKMIESGAKMGICFLLLGFAFCWLIWSEKAICCLIWWSGGRDFEDE